MWGIFPRSNGGFKRIMRKTKIVCTIGPASSDEKTLREMCLAGMNVARINFSHGTHEDHQIVIDRLKKIRAELDLPIAILLDTKGPEYRIGVFENGKIELKDNDKFTFTTEDVVGNNERVSVSYSKLAQEIDVGDVILVNDGLVKFVVESKTETELNCVVEIGGELSNRKSMSFPGKVLKQVYLSKQDKEDIMFGINNDIDYVACSFVSTKQDLVDVKNFMLRNGGGDIDIIAKIENRSGIDNIEEICEMCDGVMIGRGDMGVEIPFEELPAVQKHIITKCRMLGKRVITATEMLESMIKNPRPTRAEISDVANAVYDGTSAIMLSGETAAGKYPVKTLKTMAKIAEYTERNIDYAKTYHDVDFIIQNTLDAISHSAVGMAIDLKAKAVVVCSMSGMTARMVSRFRGPVDIVAMTTNEKAWHKLALSWGVLPKMSQSFQSTDVLFYQAKNVAREALSLSRGDLLVITGGVTNGQSGNTSILKVETV